MTRLGGLLRTQFQKPLVERSAKRAIETVGAGIALLAALLLIAPAAHAVEAAPPENLTAWLAEDGVAAVVADPNVPDIDEATVSIGSPTRAWTWSEAFLLGDSVEPLVEMQRWVAPVSVGEEISGGVVIDMADDAVANTAVVWTSQFGRASAVPVPQMVYDEGLNGWFILADGVVRPVTAEARAVLAGPMPLAEIQDYVRDWNGTLEAHETAEAIPEGSSTNMVLATTMLVAGVLVLVAIVVAVKKERER